MYSRSLYCQLWWDTALEDLGKQKDSENRVWFLDDKCFDVKCPVERYSLSAHADKNELIDLVRKVKPRQKLFFVHGNDEDRDWFRLKQPNLNSESQGMLRQELSGHCPDGFTNRGTMERWVSLESRRLQTSWKFESFRATYA